MISFNFDLWMHWSNIYQFLYIYRGHTVAQFVMVLRYKPEDLGLWFPKVSLEVISGFRHEVDENCALPGYYAASSSNFVSTFRDNQLVVLLEVLNEVILPAAWWLWVRLSHWQKWLPRIFSGRRGRKNAVDAYGLLSKNLGAWNSWNPLGL